MHKWFGALALVLVATGAHAQILLGDLVRSDGDVHEHYGWSVDLDGDRVAVGARRDGEAGTQAGAVYILTNAIQSLWLPEDKILPDEPGTSSNFGYSVALSGDTLLVGSPFSDEGTPNGGAAYVYERQPDAQWVLVQRLTAATPQEDAGFGWSVVMQGDTAVVGAFDENDGDGAAYVFVRGGDGVWTQSQRLTPPDERIRTEFGFSLDLRDGLLIVGARGDDEQILDGGSAYIYRNGVRGQWAFDGKLLPARTVNRGAFGHDVAINGDLVGIARPVGGTVLIFERDELGAWNESAELELGQLQERGGVAVTEQGMVLAGVPSGQGAIAVFGKAPSGEWYECTRMRPSDYNSLMVSSELGTAFDAEGTRVAAGSPYTGPNETGRAWLFDTMSYDYSEDFETFAAGPLVNEFGWEPYGLTPSVNGPRVQVVDSGVPGFGTRTVRYENISGEHGNRAIRSPRFGCMPDSISVDIHIAADTAEHSLLYESQNGDTVSRLYFEEGGAITVDQLSSARGIVGRVATSGSWAAGVTTRIEMVNRIDASLEFYQDGALIFAGRDLIEGPVPDPPTLYRQRARYLESEHERTDTSYFFLDNLEVVVHKAPPCPADLDGDGNVGASDLAILLAGWGGSSGGDIDGSGQVDSADLAVLLAAWNDCG